MDTQGYSSSTWTPIPLLLIPTQQQSRNHSQTILLSKKILIKFAVAHSRNIPRNSSFPPSSTSIELSLPSMVKINQFLQNNDSQSIL